MRPDELLKTLEQAGFEACFVGGCVRDTLLGRPVHDWDITTSALPEQTMALFPRCIPTGLKHGTVTVLLNGDSFEVTTFRKDGAYHDARHPDEVTFVPRLEEDLARRDFTINAMAMHLDGSITDCFHGREDLQSGVIRCVGDPDLRFREDALRMLRARRFFRAARLSDRSRNRARHPRRNAHLCRALSSERVCAETEKTLLSERPETLGVMIEEGLLAACALEGSFDPAAASHGSAGAGRTLGDAAGFDTGAGSSRVPDAGEARPPGRSCRCRLPAALRPAGAERIDGGGGDRNRVRLRGS